MSKTSSGSVVRQARRYRVSSSVTDEAIRSILEGFDCPRSLAVWLLYSSGEHQQLVDLDCRVECYNSTVAFRDAYQSTLLLSKSNFLNLDVDRKAAAMKKFWQMEDRCRLTNNRFRNLALDPNFKGSNVWLLNATTRKIASILTSSTCEDSVDGFHPEEWFASCSWGPGASTRITGTDTSSVNKFQSETGITQDLFQLIGSIIPVAFPLWGEHLESLGYSFDNGNKVLCVPKNAKTDRVIAAEPGLNCFFQLGLGEMIRRRLLRSEGIDLRTQERNGLLAFFASMSGTLATVDFSSASDCISREVVRELLPGRWFSVLDSCRSMYGNVDQEIVRWEKFSSMGNGFTFPLQSLIFYAVAHSVCEYLGASTDYIGVFGDDVILPTEAYATFVSFCEFLGFQINAEKSFSQGVFKESCGVHYANGLDVKPIYIKERLSNIDSVYRLVNAVRRLARSRVSYLGCDLCLLTAWRFLLGKVPKGLRLFIPEGYGDGGIIGNLDEAAASVKRAGNWVEGFFYRSLNRVGVKRETESLGLLLSRLFRPSSRGLRKKEGNSYPLRIITRYSISKSLAHSWEDLGSWI